MKDRNAISYYNRFFSVILTVCMLLSSGVLAATASAANSATIVDGRVYEFDKDNDYMFSGETKYEASGNADTYGSFSISNRDAVITPTGKKSGVPAYSISDGTITISYTYTDGLLTAADTAWHLVEDKEKNVDIFNLDSNIQKGAYILQRSIDHLNWSNISIQELICKGWFIPPNTYDCGSFVVNGTAVVEKGQNNPYKRWQSTQKGADSYEISI